MIQVVGPSDNDYIYIDFKDFKYNPKLEFPRENLEMGTRRNLECFPLNLCVETSKKNEQKTFTPNS